MQTKCQKIQKIHPSIHTYIHVYIHTYIHTYIHQDFTLFVKNSFLKKVEFGIRFVIRFLICITLRTNTTSDLIHPINIRKQEPYEAFKILNTES